ncbi:MAG: restriction endonuclease subunit S [Paludibacteraceae bacterium]|nr:restriction endonuclease subunit S [Paludibacteraceae bacterium]MBR5825219.1 restriction endonuclease subunit S [Paludibacteraceae bacterium]
MELKKYKLGDVAKIEISGVDKKIKENETPVKLCNFVDVYYNWAITSNMEKKFMMATARTNEIERFKLKRGQVALTKDSETRFDIGIATYIADDFDNVILGYHNALITPNPEKLNGKYLNALLHTDYARTYFANNASGSGQRYALSVDALNNFPVLPIPLAEQKHIGDIFSSIDQKIALNRQINQNLEAMAKQLYDYWFVQFDFPNDEGKPYKSSGGKMVYNPKLKRQIPEGWECTSLGEIIQELESGKRPKGGIDKTLKEGIPSLGAEAISKLGDFDYAKTPYVPYDTKINSGVIRNNDILVYKDGAYVGKTTLYRDNFPYEYATINEHVFLLRTIDPKMQEYIFFTLQKDYLFDVMQNLGKAKAAQPGLNQDDLKGIEILQPNKEYIYKYKETIEPLLAKLFNNAKEIASLTQQRDELLPLLMNGQVSVD